MRDHYDFENMETWKNPYAKRLKQLKQSVTIRLDSETVVYFKDLAGETGMPYQNLINLYLRDCAAQKKRPKVEWTA